MAEVIHRSFDLSRNELFLLVWLSGEVLRGLKNAEGDSAEISVRLTLPDRIRLESLTQRLSEASRSPAMKKVGFQPIDPNRKECPNGHPWVQSNLYTAPGRTVKVCKTCRKESNRRNRKAAALKAYE